MRCRLLVFALATFSLASLALAQDRETKVRKDKNDVLEEGFWLYNDLKAAGVDANDGKREFIGKEAYISLSSLAPAAAYVFDEKNLTLRLTTRVDRQGATKFDLTPTAPKGMLYSQDTSFFVNYAAETKGFSQYDAFGEAGLSMAGHLLTSTIRRTEEGHVVRGLSNLTLNDRDNLTLALPPVSLKNSSARFGFKENRGNHAARSVCDNGSSLRDSAKRSS